MRKLASVGVPLLLIGVLLAAIALPQQISLWRDREERNTIYVKEIVEEKPKPLTTTRKMRLLWDMMSAQNAIGRKEAHPISSESDASLLSKVDQMLRSELSAWQEGGILPESIDVQTFSISNGQIVRYYDTTNLLQMTTYDLYATDSQGNAVQMILDEETGKALQAEVRLSQENFLVSTSEAIGDWYFNSLQITAVSKPVSEDTTWFAIEKENLVYRITLEDSRQQIAIVPVGLMSQIWEQNEIDTNLMENGR